MLQTPSFSTCTFTVHYLHLGTHFRAFARCFLAASGSLVPSVASPRFSPPCCVLLPTTKMLFFLLFSFAGEAVRSSKSKNKFDFFNSTPGVCSQLTVHNGTTGVRYVATLPVDPSYSRLCASKREPRTRTGAKRGWMSNSPQNYSMYNCCILEWPSSWLTGTEKAMMSLFESSIALSVNNEVNDSHGLLSLASLDIINDISGRTLNI